MKRFQFYLNNRNAIDKNDHIIAMITVFCIYAKLERQIENDFIEKLKELKYTYREDIKDKAALEENFRNHFQNLNRVRLSNSEFLRLKESIITSDVFAAAQKLREINTFKRDDDTPLQYTLVNYKARPASYFHQRKWYRRRWHFHRPHPPA